MAPRKKKEESKPGHVIRLNGKEYITHIGLLDLAHKAGFQGIDGGFVPELCDPEKERWVYRAVVQDSEGRQFVAHGHASPKNLNGKIRDFAAVMAETRAWNRAIRSMVNHGETTADEMASVGLDSRPVINEDVEPYTVSPDLTAKKAKQVAKKAERVLKVDPEKWWQPVQSLMLECPGQPTPGELDEMCQHWSKGKLTAEDLSVERLMKLVKQVASGDGQELLHDIRERAAIKEEGAGQ